ncbi:MAG: serine/threonine protein kinase [Cyanobacteria bacterium P01_H01_bin.119]
MSFIEGQQAKGSLDARLGIERAGLSIDVSDILGSPYEFLLAYPRLDQSGLQERSRSLLQLGVERLYSAGAVTVYGLPEFRVLGLGYCGLVVLARWQGRLVALKVRRPDAGKLSLAQEARWLGMANQSGIGPRYIAHTPNFLLMSYLAGEDLLSWVTCRAAAGDAARVQQVLGQLLDAGFRLDQLGLDHGNLRCVTQHAIVQGDMAQAGQGYPGGCDRVQLIDFSAASLKRRAANVTTLAQGLWISTAIARVVNQLFPVHKAALIERLRAYKQGRDRLRFEHLMELVLQSKG